MNGRMAIMDRNCTSIVMGLHRNLVDHIINHSTSKTSSSLKPNINESLDVFFAILAKNLKPFFSVILADIFKTLSLFWQRFASKKVPKTAETAITVTKTKAKTLYKLHLHDFRRLLTVSFSLMLMLFIIKDCLYA